MNKRNSKLALTCKECGHVEEEWYYLPEEGEPTAADNDLTRILLIDLRSRMGWHRSSKHG